MTGKHSGHTSVRSNGGGTPLRAGEITIASALKNVGYATGGYGKWGCGGRGSTGVPEEHGFDEFLGYYDLNQDLSEQNNLAASHKETLAKMKAYAMAAHEPVREGIFHNRAIHEKDRQAKFGDTRQARAQTSPVSFPTKGLIPQNKMTLLRFSSEAQANNRRARCAFDGKPLTHWHSQFQPTGYEHPHELVLNLGKPYRIKGFRYLARQDNGWNGAFKDCEFYVSNDPQEFAQPALKTQFKKTKEPQDILCTPVTGRYVLIKVLSEVNNGPWASAAEIGMIKD